jgi:phosphoribosylformylglycinamidine cyclo-ligase
MGLSYAAAGVDIDAGNRAVARMKALARATSRPEVLADIGPFAALFRLNAGGSYTDPVLVASTDGVGTKVKIARALGRYDTIGRDLVNACVNDVLTAGAQPLFFLDYIAGNGLAEDAKIALVAGMADACREAGCALVGGETADMPGVYAPGEFDLAGFVVGIVERAALLDGSCISEGDLLIALPSDGLHTNGYSLVRAAFGVCLGGPENDARDRELLARTYPELEGMTLGDALLVPHRSYVRDLRAVLPRLKGLAHITGGGLIDNLPRILPAGLAARIDRSSWTVPPLFGLIQRTGQIAEEEMFRTFNMGIGMIAVAAPDDARALLDAGMLPDAWIAGSVVQNGFGANDADGPRVQFV